MRFATIASLFAAAASAAPAVLSAVSARAEYGCTVNLEPNVEKPADSGEIILFAIINKWTSTSTSTSFSSNYLDARNTVSAPYYVVFLAGAIPGYESDAEMAAVLDTWVGTWLRGGDEPAYTTNSGDYMVTSVVCT
ncbi:hypothetical protein GGR56DRAFT_668549 [Xylariaceae sp. FL0804]|nr:hypothetical protein GGR56DRAFT_668549 [Xylariaceae sp. FL0804]